MTYIQSLRYLNSFLNLERIVWPAENRFWNLKRMHHLLKRFDHPEKSFFPVLIAGTKGKGSTGFFLESILKTSRVSCGFYSSPHLETPLERIRINGKKVSKAEWVRGIMLIRRGLGTRPQNRFDPIRGVTYFEIMTLLAMILFKRSGVQIGIFEVGLGGRLDATNVMDASLSVLTPIHRDHEAFLGSRLADIAREKGAIMRTGADVVLAPQRSEVMRSIRNQAKQKRAVLWSAGALTPSKTGLYGDYQNINAGVARKAAARLRDRFGYGVSGRAMTAGVLAKGWPGRFEVLHRSPTLILDGAHNPSSVLALTRNLQRTASGKERVLIFGTSRDKRYEPMLRTLGTFFTDIILMKTDNPRSQELRVLLPAAGKYFKRLFPVFNFKDAFDLACRRVGRDGMILVTGSFYLIGEARQCLKRGLNHV